MTAEAPVGPPTAAPATRKRGRCCLWSCGCLVLLALLLALAGWLGYRYYGAPWLETQKERLVERFPAAGALLQIKGLKDQLLEGGKVSGGEIGSELRDDFPGDVFLPAGESRALFNTTDSAALAALSYSSAAPGELAARIRRAMEDTGWRRAPAADPPDGLRLHFEKEDRLAAYEIFASGGEVHVWIELSPTGGPGSPRSR